MRPAAQVDPVALPVEADLVLVRNAGDDLGLVDLPQSREELHRLIARHDAARDFLVCPGQLGHLRFDGREILRGEGALVGKVVIKAVLDDRADGHLRLREQLLHRLRQQVRRGVADDLEPIGILVGHDGETGILGNHVGGVDQLAVHARGERRLAQPGANAARDLVHGHRVVEAALTAIGQGDNGHSGDFQVYLRPQAARSFRPRHKKEGAPGFLPIGSALFTHLVGASGIEPPTTTMSR